MRRTTLCKLSVSTGLVLLALAVDPWPLQLMPRLGMPAVLAQPAATIRLENVTIGTVRAALRMKRLEVTGTPLGETEIRALLTAGSDGVEAFSRLTAERVMIPELAIDQNIQSFSQTVTYRDVVLKGVVNGKVAELSIGGGGGQSLLLPLKPGRGSPTYVTVDFGPVVLNDVSLPAVIAAALGRRTGGQPLEPLYGSLSASMLRLARPDIELSVGRIQGGPAKGHELTLPSSEVVARVPSETGPAPEPEETATLLERLKELVHAFEFASLTLDTVSINPKGLAPLSIGSVKMADVARSKLGELSLYRISIIEPEGTLAVRSLALRDIDLTNLLGGVGDIAARLRERGPTLGHDAIRFSDPIAGIKFLRASLPSIGQITLSGGDFETRTPSTMKTTLETLDVKAEAWQIGIPSRLAVSLDKLNLGIDPLDPDMQGLTAAGITNLDVSGGVMLGWDPALRTIVGDVSAASEKLGTVRLRISMGNAGPELFDIEPLMQQVGLFSLTATGAEVGYTDTGLAAAAFNFEAKRQGKSVVALKQELIAAIQLQLPSILGNSEKARTLANGLARFVANPSSLSVQARAPAGIGAGDLATPERIVEKIDLTIGPKP